MEQTSKELLLKDLCGRLPYGVKIAMPGLWDSKITIEPLNEIFKGDDDLFRVNGNGHCIEYIKPYLFPLSSMTKEQYEEWCNLEGEPLDEILTRNSNGEKMSTLEHHLLIAKSLIDPVNYCYKNHFDIYGLIPMGLAEDATGKNIY